MKEFNFSSFWLTLLVLAGSAKRGRVSSPSHPPGGGTQTPSIMTNNKALRARPGRSCALNTVVRSVSAKVYKYLRLEGGLRTTQTIA